MSLLNIIVFTLVVKDCFNNIKYLQMFAVEVIGRLGQPQQEVNLFIERERKGDVNVPTAEIYLTMWSISTNYHKFSYHISLFIKYFLNVYPMFINYV